MMANNEEEIFYSDDDLSDSELYQVICNVMCLLCYQSREGLFLFQNQSYFMTLTLQLYDNFAILIYCKGYFSNCCIFRVLIWAQNIFLGNLTVYLAVNCGRLLVDYQFLLTTFLIRCITLSIGELALVIMGVYFHLQCHRFV